MNEKERLINYGKEYWQPTLSVLAILVSFAGVGLSYHIINKTLPLSSVGLVFTEENTEINYYGLGSEDKADDYVEIVPVIKNTGLSPAENVRLKVFIVFEDKNLSFRDTDTNIIKGFDNKLVYDLQPGSSASFGSVVVDRLYGQLNNSNSYDLFDNSEPLILMYSLTYRDPLTRESESQCYAFRFNLGSNSLRTLIFADYEKITDFIEEYKDKKHEDICEKTAQ